MRITHKGALKTLAVLLVSTALLATPGAARAEEETAAKTEAESAAVAKVADKAKPAKAEATEDKGEESADGEKKDADATPAAKPGELLIKVRFPDKEGVAGPGEPPPPPKVWSGKMPVRRSTLADPNVKELPPMTPDHLPANVKGVAYSPGVFKADPTYEDKEYEAAEQVKIYGGKYANPPVRPLIESGRELYSEGPLKRGKAGIFGAGNPTTDALWVFGDWQTVLGYNNNGNGFTQGTLATRLNVNINYQMTGTERIHAFFRPLDEGGDFTRYDFGGNGNAARVGERTVLDFKMDGLFFEGEVGPILKGWTGKPNTIDIPFSVGLMPFVLQNGVWVEDAFEGFAFNIATAKNSAKMDISNYDITAFFGFDYVSSQAIRSRGAGILLDRNADVYGTTAFIEANEGYWELGYGFTNGFDEADDLDYHNVTAAFSKRYFDKISNSTRVIWNFGQDPVGRGKTADGIVWIIENAFITSKPVTFVPYLNLWAGWNHPQSLARDAGANFLLKNEAMSFETDNISKFPTMDGSANDTYGFAAGMQYLFNLDRQIVAEVVGLRVHGDDVDAFGVPRNARGNQFGGQVRYQQKLSRCLLFRVDAMAAGRNLQEDIAGSRIEFRRKF